MSVKSRVQKTLLAQQRFFASKPSKSKLRAYVEELAARGGRDYYDKEWVERVTEGLARRYKSPHD